MAEVDRLLSGAIDTHVHHGPDPMIERRYDAWETVVKAREMGLGGLVLKSHSYPTAPLARTVASLAPDMAVVGSLCLEHETGGINPFAVETSARLGAKVLWMPTSSAANSQALFSRRLGVTIKGEPLSLLDGQGKLLPPVLEVLGVVKEYQMVLATGHISPRELLALVPLAQRMGISKIVITHPTEKGVLEALLTADEINGLAQSGAFVEYCCIGLMPTGGRQRPRDVVDSIRGAGVAHCILSSDFGQIQHPHCAEGMRLFIALMLQSGFTPAEVEVMVKTNPRRLLDLS